MIKRTALMVLVAVVALAAGYFSRDLVAPHEHARESQAKPGQLWTCGMHPQVIRDKPGFCPICGMALTPLESQPPETAAARGRPISITIDPAVVQNMGVRFAAAVEGPVRRRLRTVAYLAEAQPNQHDVNLRVGGWIERLYANTEGMHLAEGAPLFDLYSPELQVAIEELIGARRAGESPMAKQLSASAERKLGLLGLTAEHVAQMARLERAPRTVTFTSPAHGHLVEKKVVEGSAVKAGDTVLRIVDHSRLWIDAQVHEQQLPFVRYGQSLSATVEGIPGKTFSGQVMFIHPHVDEMTRTAMVRAWIDNPVLELRPGMYATVEIQAEVAPRAVLVPREAVIDTGERQVAFVGLEAGHFEPRQVVMGSPAEDGMVQILDGLAAGEIVVTSGQFLLDAESRFREAIAKFQAGQRPSGAGVDSPVAGPRPQGSGENRDHAHH